MTRWLWICPILGVLLIVTVLFYWGWSRMAALVIVFAVICPAVMAWGTWKIRHADSTDFDPKTGQRRRK